MPASTAFQTTYLEPGGAIYPLTGGNRFAVAGAVYGLVAKLREGYSAANAQAYVATVPRYNKALSDALAAGGAPAASIVTDFQAITTI